MFFAIALAAALQSAGDIKTGADLLAACQQQDTTACDRYILQVSSKPTANVPCQTEKLSPAGRRRAVIKLIQTDGWRRNQDAYWTAAAVAGWCGGD